MTTTAEDATNAQPDAPDIWLSFDQAAGLFAISAPRFAALIDQGILAVHAAPSGMPGVMKRDVAAWHRADLASRRAALAAFAAQIDGEVFR
jgi:hypothetical protein